MSDLNSISLVGVQPQPDFDRIYIENRLKIEKADALRLRCITMLQSFSRAHTALVKEMNNRRTYSEFTEELYDLSMQVLAISNLFGKK